MTPAPPSRPLWVRLFLMVLCGGLIVTFIGLGNWQMRRLSWKLDLIEAVEARAFGTPVSPPCNFQAVDHAYLRVRVTGMPIEAHFLVKAVTELGPGYWVMSPLDTDTGILWVNRGFVARDAPSNTEWTRLPGSVEGLVRPTEPNGTILERNDPASGRWVSRDTRAMSDALGLGPTQRYFVDADHIGHPQAWPRGGLTILKFRNNHLSYALTWYAMAALLFGTLIVITWRKRQD
ncbi:MAG: SURF1 family protein [Pseudomonadota bacterium]